LKTKVAPFVLAAGLYLYAPLGAHGQFSPNNYFNFETAPVHPAALSPDGTKLAVCNLPKGHLELFDITSGVPVSFASIPVGIDPVSVSFRTTNEIWVANYISKSISIIDLPTLRVSNTITTSNQPSDIVFAGNPQQAYVSCGQPNLVQVFNPQTSQWVTNLVIDGNRPRAMTVSPDGSTVYAAIFESGNASTIIGSGVTQLGSLPNTNAVSLSAAPSHGLNPPPNSGTNFVPAINPALTTNLPPKVGLIVKKNGAGRWMDDNNGDWTEYIRGTNAASTGRVPGWDMPDHDLAVINTANFAITYASGLMNICMAAAVNPATGKISVVGTDALNNIRFEPVLQSIFIRVNLAQVDPVALNSTITDLNPHLDYQTRQVSPDLVMASIGDPRGMVWSSDGTRAYISGMGSDNVVIINAQGARAGLNPAINVGQGPTGLALDEGRNRLYVYNRFDDSISTIDTVAQTVVNTLPLFDPTPQVIKAGRPHLYNTHQTSGLGQAACASCHVDARFDRLAWDLGSPTGVMNVIGTNFNFGGTQPLRTNNFHPMKGPMVTQTLQNIIGHEPFHWRGDREGIEAFSPTFNDLQGMPGTFTTNQMAELKGFLATVGFGPNPYRPMDNSLPTGLPLPGQLALGRGTLPAGAQLPNGNAQSGQTTFRGTIAICSQCHTLPAGLGTDSQFNGSVWKVVALSTNGSHHASLSVFPRTANLPFKIPSLRNMTDKMGMSLTSTNSRAGFGFFNDGSVDTLVRLLQDGFAINNDQTTADLVAFLVSFTGSDLISGSVTTFNQSPGMSSLDTQAGVGRQITINTTNDVSLVDTMLTLAAASTNRMDLIVKGMKNGVARGWFFNTTNSTFLSDRHGETYSAAALRALAAAGSEQTYMLVPKGSGMRLGIDRDLDGNYDGDLLVNALTTTSNGLTISWASVAGLNYQLQYKNALSDPAWNTLPNSIAGTGNTISMTDNTVGANQARYYRVTTTQQ
jgi:YVTN family beta-propeller protein